jgi:hypothetical protein
MNISKTTMAAALVLGLSASASASERFENCMQKLTAINDYLESNRGDIRRNTYFGEALKRDRALQGDVQGKSPLEMCYHTPGGGIWCDDGLAGLPTAGFDLADECMEILDEEEEGEQ